MGILMKLMILHHPEKIPSLPLLLCIAHCLPFLQKILICLPKTVPQTITDRPLAGAGTNSTVGTTTLISLAMVGMVVILVGHRTTTDMTEQESVAIKAISF
jgi:hypothetical protein